MMYMKMKGPKTSDADAVLGVDLSWATFDGQWFTIEPDVDTRASYSGIYTGTIYRQNQFTDLRSDYTFDLAMCWIT